MLSDRQFHWLRAAAILAIIIGLVAGLLAEFLLPGAVGSQIATAGVRSVPILAGALIFVSAIRARRRKLADDLHTRA